MTPINRTPLHQLLLVWLAILLIMLKLNDCTRTQFQSNFDTNLNYLSAYMSPFSHVNMESIYNRGTLKPKTQCNQQFSEKITSSEALTLKGFVRGHKCLFDDTNINNGNIVYLLRGADASQRLLYPLELMTNEPFLKGYKTALKMFEYSKEAISFATETMFSKFKSLDTNDSAGSFLKDDMPRYHRLLQYSIAAGLDKDFLRKESFKYNIELYDEMGINVNALISGIQAFKEFYQNILPDEEMQKNFLPSWNNLLQQISNMKLIATATRPEQINPRKVTFERDPEAGTVSELIVDLKSANIDDFPKAIQPEINELLSKHKSTSKIV